MRFRLLFLTLLATACSARLAVPDDAVIRCDNGGECPSGRVCVEDLAVCVPPGSSCVEDLGDRFVAAADGNLCVISAGAGVCRNGQCVPAFCGDGTVQADTEECDDGNANENDGCGACRISRWSSAIAFGLGPGGRSLATASFNDLQRLATGPNGSIFAGYGARRAPPSFGGPPTTFEYTYGGLLGMSIEVGSWFFVSKPSSQGLETLTERVSVRTTALGLVSGLAVDKRGRLSFAMADFSTEGDTELTSYAAYVFRVSGDNTLEILTGGPTRCAANSDLCGDGQLARYGSLFAPNAIAFDRLDRLHFVDGNRVRRIDTNDRLAAVAGSGLTCPNPTDTAACGDGAAAVGARFIGPLSIAFDAQGQLFIADAGAHRIRRVDLAGVIHAEIGDGSGCATFPDCPGPGLFAHPKAMAFDGDTVLVVDSKTLPVGLTEPLANSQAQSAGDVVRRVTLGQSPVTTRVFGTGELCGAQPCRDGGPAVNATTGQLRDIVALGERRYAVIDDTRGPDSFGSQVPPRIRIVNLDSGRVDAFAGRTETAPTPTGQISTSADGGTAIVARATNGDVVFASAAQVFRAREVDGLVELLAGSAARCGAGPCATGGNADTFHFGEVTSIAEHDGVVFVTDRARRVFSVRDGIVAPVFGNGVECPATTCPDVSDATEAQVHSVDAIATNGVHLYVADGLGNAIWDATLGAGAERISGTGERGGSGDGGAALAATWRCPSGLSVADDGSLDVADTDNCRVRHVANGQVTAVFQGTCETEATVDLAPCGVWFNSYDSFVPWRVARAGNELYVSNRTSRVVFRVDGAGLSLFAGGGPEQPNLQLLEGELATAASFTSVDFPAGHAYPEVAVAGRAGYPLLVAHGFAANSALIREVVDGRLHTVVGAIDGALTGPFAVAEMSAPRYAASGTTKRWVIDDGFIREVDVAQRAVTTILGAVAGRAPTEGPARFTEPLPDLAAIAAASDTQLYAVTTGGTLYSLSSVAAGPWTIAPIGTIAPDTGAAITALAYGVEQDIATLYASDRAVHVVYAVDPRTAATEIIAGERFLAGYAGDGGDATSGLLDTPQGLLVSASGALFVADQGNNRVRRLRRDATGTRIIETVIGTGEASSSASGTPARSFPVDRPRGLAFDAFGNLLIVGGPTVRIVYADAASPLGEPTPESPTETILDTRTTPSTRGGLLDCLAAVFPGAPSEIYALDACSGAALRLAR